LLVSLIDRHKLIQGNEDYRRSLKISAGQSEFLDHFNLFCNQMPKPLDVPIYLPQLLVTQA
jgi:hypothetical protein